MIETLSNHHVKANFFIDGAFAAKHKDLIQMIEEEGHLIGSHGYNHKDFAQMSKAEASANLEKANSILSSLIDQDIEWFAPPSGSFTMAAVEAAREQNMHTILWTVDSIDWKNPTEEVFLHRVTSKLHNGATILLHPTAVTAAGLGELVTAIQKNYKIGTLNELMSEKRGG
ncbi:polysaccharide deacetylase family protein [Halobacillus amylolyticus]|uniref:Polysaccharide deacetylase family protein n=1 Tax=Halobacillus amylolyticus TaxID=2932259 RepID=A0ABY4HCS7_9BACI|nr:polysaccharide deacetylase family protein [Halobacillus amylolyticus]UOR12683.1 polysaccharide deacetylase family protein [Halobacillus amylolyticus]